MEQATEPNTVAAAPPTCDQPDCQEAAVFTYAWDWGAKGVCCAKHQFLLQQSSEQLQRRVNFSPLQLAAPAPMTRDERAKLKGEVYALEMEIVDLKDRGSSLYRENTTLTRQCQAATTRLRETELQLSESKRQILSLQDSLEQRDAEHGDLVDEVGRLRTLEKFVSDPTTPADRGLTPPAPQG